MFLSADAGPEIPRVQEFSLIIKIKNVWSRIHYSLHSALFAFWKKNPSDLILRDSEEPDMSMNFPDSQIKYHSNFQLNKKNGMDWKNVEEETSL